MAILAKRKRPEYSYDSRCEDLADVFLDGQAGATPRDAFDLAQVIQEAIEGRLSTRFPEPSNV